MGGEGILEEEEALGVALSAPLGRSGWGARLLSLGAADTAAATVSELSSLSLVWSDGGSEALGPLEVEARLLHSSVKSSLMVLVVVPSVL